MRTNNPILWLAASIGVCYSLACHKSNVPGKGTDNFNEDTSLAFLSFSIAGTNSQVTFNYPDIMLRFPDSVTAPGMLAASFTLSPNDVATVAGTPQVSGVTANNFDFAFIYMVKNQDHDSAQWQVVGTNNDYTVPWGLGQWLQLSKSNDRDYNWYIDQGATGSCSLVNCGPACATMAMKWSDSTFTGTTDVARNYFATGCTDWNNQLLSSYLSTDSVPWTFIPIHDSAPQMRDDFKAQLDSGRIVIISLDMGPIPFSTSGVNAHVDQFLPGAGFHYIILKGYRQTDEDFFFEVYDPWDFGTVYPDNTPKGENRYYRSEDIALGVVNDGGGTQIAVSKKW